MLFVSMVLQFACTSEQLKGNTYQALHKHQQIQCQQEGRGNCLEYESYFEYEKKRKEAHQFK